MEFAAAEEEYINLVNNGSIAVRIRGEANKQAILRALQTARKTAITICQEEMRDVVIPMRGILVDEWPADKPLPQGVKKETITAPDGTQRDYYMVRRLEGNQINVDYRGTTGTKKEETIDDGSAVVAAGQQDRLFAAANVENRATCSSITAALMDLDHPDPSNNQPEDPNLAEPDDATATDSSDGECGIFMQNGGVLAQQTTQKSRHCASDESGVSASSGKARHRAKDAGAGNGKGHQTAEAILSSIGYNNLAEEMDASLKRLKSCPHANLCRLNVQERGELKQAAMVECKKSLAYTKRLSRLG